MMKKEDYNIPTQNIEFFVKDTRGYKHKCSGEFTGTLRNLGYTIKATDCFNHNLGIEVKLYASYITIAPSEEEEQYIKRIEEMEKELKELKNKIQCYRQY